MSNEPHDDLPLPHFEDRLWDELAELHPHARGATTAGPQGRASLDRRARRSLLVGVGATAAAAAVVAAVVIAQPTGPPGTSTDAGGPVSVEARIIAATDEALADSVVHTVQDATTGSDSEMWSDEQSGLFRSLSLDESGDPSLDTGPASPPGVDDVGPPPIPPDVPPFDPSLPSGLHRQVDHCFSEYRDYEETLLPARNEAQRVREGLEDGTMREDGTQVVDGRELIRIVPLLPDGDAPGSAADGDGPPTTVTVPPEPPTTITTPPPPTTVPAGDDEPPAPTTTVPADPGATDGDDDATTVDGDHTTLVDPSTYRPVMVIGYPDSDAEYVMTIEYLPRTPENLALLSPPLPDGFVESATVRGDGERVDRCGW
jgi:hypothetical protein